MPDGSRKRRFSPDEAKRRWYAGWRHRRFMRRFGLLSPAPAMLRGVEFDSNRQRKRGPAASANPWSCGDE